MNLRWSEGLETWFPVASNDTITRGHAVALASSGNVVQKMSGASQTFVGIALGMQTRGTERGVEVMREGEITVSVSGTEPTNWLGAQVYWDGTNNVFTFTSTNNTAVGRVVHKDGSLYRVAIIPSW